MKFRFFGFILIVLLSCNSDDAENTINCLFAGADFDVNHSIDPDNSLMVNFTVDYDGEFNLDNSVDWDFGDGTTQTLSGTQASHEYSSPGNYSVKVKPTIRDGGAFCTPELTENVSVN
jgi:PKD repeat protein